MTTTDTKHSRDHGLHDFEAHGRRLGGISRLSVIRTYAALIVACVGVTLLGAIVQHIVVLGIPMDQLQPRLALMPMIVGTLMGAMLATIRILQRRTAHAVELLSKREAAIRHLNRDLELRVEERTAELQRQLYTDPLTGLPNRARLIRDIASAEARYSLMLFNIDAFKEINDFYGTDVGDLVLKELGCRFAAFAEGGGDDTVYKLSGDEFALLGRQQTDLETLRRRAGELLLRVTADPVAHPRAGEVVVRGSMGVVPWGIVRGERLLPSADMALKQGRIKHLDVVVFDEAFADLERSARNIRAARLVRDAIEAGQVEAYFQPILNNTSGAIDKYETLARIVRDGEVISPFEFMAAAKATRLYPHITRRVFDLACQTFAHTPHQFSINLSIDDILNRDTVDYLLGVLRQVDYADRVIFEILESEGIENFSEVTSFIERVKACGGRIAIDDFGTGYSNFEYILRLEVDYLKLDASLIRNIDSDTNSQIVVRTIKSFAREMGIELVGEFVHSAPVLDTVRALGVDYSQGYFIGKPAPGLAG